jgi:hypothetical protein
VGFALTDKMDIIGVVNNSGKRGAGQEAAIEALVRGGKTLDCYNGFLAKNYRRFSFVENKSKRAKWDDQYAPEGWNYEQHGKPDIVYFEYPEGLSRDRADIRGRFEAARGGKPGREPGNPKSGGGGNQPNDRGKRGGLDTPEQGPTGNGTGVSERVLTRAAAQQGPLSPKEILKIYKEGLADAFITRIMAGEASPSDLNAARQFLKDNGISCDGSRNAALGALADSLPDMLPPASEVYQ